MEKVEERKTQLLLLTTTVPIKAQLTRIIL